MRHASDPSEVCKADPRATPLSPMEKSIAPRCSTREQIKPKRGRRPAVFGACNRDAQWTIGGIRHCTNHAAAALAAADEQREGNVCRPRTA